jgi:hypothetical protein
MPLAPEHGLVSPGAAGGNKRALGASLGVADLGVVNEEALAGGASVQGVVAFQEVHGSSSPWGPRSG